MNTITDANGAKHLQSVPLTLDCTSEQKSVFEKSDRVAISWNNDVVAVIEKPEFYPNRKEEISCKTFGTRSLKH